MKEGVLIPNQPYSIDHKESYLSAIFLEMEVSVCVLAFILYSKNNKSALRILHELIFYSIEYVYQIRLSQIILHILSNV